MGGAAMVSGWRGLGGRMDWERIAGVAVPVHGALGCVGDGILAACNAMAVVRVG